MNEEFSPSHDGFEDRNNAVSNVKCRRPQNSYQLMLERLGPWAGGAKPAPQEAAPAISDAGAARDAEELPGVLDVPGAVDAGASVEVQPLPPPRTSEVAGKGGGCNYATTVLGQRDLGGLGVWLAAIGAGLVGRTLRRRRTST